MPALRTYRLFISHAWDHNADYYRLVEMLDNAPNFKHFDYSVPRHDPLEPSGQKDLENQLKAQIRPAQLVIVLAGMYAAHSDWIKFEIEFAASLMKPLIGVVPWGQERTPTVVSDAVIEMVRWNTDSIVTSIRANAMSPAD